MKTKKLISILITIAMAVSLLPTMSFTAFAEDTVTECYCLDVDAGAYIDTGFTPSSNTRVVMDAVVTMDASWANLFGVYREGSYFYVNNTINHFGAGFGSDEPLWVSPFAFGRHKIELDRNVFKLDGNVKHTFSGGNFQSSDAMYLFALNFYGNVQFQGGQHIRFYSCEIYESGVLRHKFVPAKQGDVLGVCDKQNNNKFYELKGSYTVGNLTVANKEQSTSVYSTKTLGSDLSDITFYNVVFDNVKSSGNGACVYIESSDSELHVNFINCKFIGCGANYGGAIYIAGSDDTYVNFKNCIAVDCAAEKRGGFIYSENPKAKINGYNSTIVKHCTAKDDGGAVYIEEGESIDGITFINNISEGDGGAVLLDSGADEASISNCVFCDNIADDGGAVYIDHYCDDTNINDSLFYNNDKDSDGDRIYALDDCSDTTESNCTFLCDSSTCGLSNHINYSGSNVSDDCSHTGTKDYKLSASDDGKYHIKNSDEWFRLYLETINGNTFNGKTVVLDKDVSAYKTLGDFYGTFEGNGHSVTILESGEEYKGIFSLFGGTKISALSAYGIIEKCSYAGGIAGMANNTTFTDCTSNVLIQDAYDYIGGIAGSAEDGSQFIDCTNHATISGNDYVGGIAGWSDSGSKFINCSNSADISGNADVAGIAGRSDDGPSFLSCENRGDITANENGGGICACAVSTGAGANYNTCINYGTITVGNITAGGICGYSSVCTAKNCTNSASVKGTADYIGGIAGWSGNTSQFTNCTNNSDVSGNNHIGGIAGYSGDNSSFPNCTNNAGVSGKNNVAGICGSTGAGSGYNTCENNGNITASENGGGICGSAGAGVSCNTCKNNGTVTLSGKNAGGICGSAGAGSGCNTCENKGNITAGENAGGICGKATGTNITLCLNEKEVKANNKIAGGIVGFIDGVSTLLNNMVYGNVRANDKYAGGIIGYEEAVYQSGNSKITVQNCYSCGNVSANSDKGGITGHSVDSSEYENCYYDNKNLPDDGHGTGLTTEEMNNEYQLLLYANSYILANDKIKQGFLYINLTKSTQPYEKSKLYFKQDIDPIFLKIAFFSQDARVGDTMEADISHGFPESVSIPEKDAVTQNDKSLLFHGYYTEKDGNGTQVYNSAGKATSKFFTFSKEDLNGKGELELYACWRTVAAGIGYTYYNRLDTAVNAAKAGDTIKMYSDVDVRAPIVFERRASEGQVDKKLTLDLNGCTIRCNSMGFAMLVEDGVSLDIKNVDTNSRGTISNIGKNDRTVIMNNGGNIKVDDKRVRIFGQSTDRGSGFAIENHKGNVEIRQGTLEGYEYNGTSAAGLWVSGGRADIYGGTLSGGGDRTLSACCIYATNGQTNIHGGSYTGTVHGIYVNGANATVNIDNNATIRITGNGEQKTQEGTNRFGYGVYVKSGKCNINGGVINGYSAGVCSEVNDGIKINTKSSHIQCAVETDEQGNPKPAIAGAPGTTVVDGGFFGSDVQDWCNIGKICYYAADVDSKSEEECDYIVLDKSGVFIIKGQDEAYTGSEIKGYTVYGDAGGCSFTCRYTGFDQTTNQSYESDAPPVNCGTYTAEVTYSKGAETNSKEVSFTVKPADLIITPKPGMKKLCGQDDPTLEFTTESLKTDADKAAFDMFISKNTVLLREAGEDAAFYSYYVNPDSSAFIKPGEFASNYKAITIDENSGEQFEIVINKENKLLLELKDNTFTVTPYGNDTKIGTVVVALYDNEKCGRLLGVKIYDLAKGENPQDTFDQSGFVKAMWWSDLSTMTPLCAPVYFAKINFRNVDGHNYYPVFGDVPEGVHFYDQAGNEYTSMNSNIAYAIVERGAVVHTVRAVSDRWNNAFADSSEGVYPYSACEVKDAFLKYYLVGGDENTEKVCMLDGNPDTREEILTYNGISMADIWNSYKNDGFLGDYGSAWSSTKLNSAIAYCYDCNYKVWMNPYATSSNIYILISRDFSAD